MHVIYLRLTITCDLLKTDDYNVSARMCHESFKGAEVAFVWKK